MHFVEMDGTRLTVLMIAGGLFSAAGILLMFRKKQDGSSARLELFGQKFEATSIGIVVFLIGAAFLATPMFVPERPVAPTVGSAASEDRRVVPAGPQDTTSLLPRAVDKDESEKNDSISGATVVEVGQTARGEAQPGDLDWYAVSVDAKSNRVLHVVFRRTGGICPWFNILDSDENVVHNAQVCEISVSADVPIKSNRYFVQIDPRFEAVSYELAVSYKQ